jgi:V8-like Glu-specific endopeptidase
MYRFGESGVLTLLLLAYVVVGCGDAPDSAPATGSHAAPIIDGTPLVGDLAVVALIMDEMPRSDSLTCTGTLVSSHVVLTAGHCLTSQGHEGWARYVYFGDDLASRGDLRRVKKWLTHPKYQGDYTADFRIENDIGVLILEDAAPGGAIPYPLGRKAPKIGQAARFVGFGCRETGRCGPIGEKYQVTTSITAISDHDFDYGVATRGGDSGGPAFLVEDGAEVLAGVTSTGDGSCDTYGVDTRVDAFAPWIEWVMAAEDPSTCTGADCPCAADGRCSIDCSRPGNDPDCPTNCGADGTCNLDCPERDRDCPAPLADGQSCALDSDCASDVCQGTCRSLCNPEADVACGHDLRCEQRGRFGAYACVSPPTASGCHVGGKVGSFAAMPGRLAAFGLWLGLLAWRRAVHSGHRERPGPGRSPRKTCVSGG